MPFRLFHIQQFLRGVVLTGLADAIPDDALRGAVNVRTDRRLGVLTNRPGWAVLTGTAFTGAVLWVSKLFGASATDYSYLQVATGLWRLSDSWASEVEILTPGAQVVSDANVVDGEGGIWKFIVNDTVASKDNGTSFSNIGIAAPTAVPTTALAADLSTTIDAMDATAGWTLAGGTSLAIDGTTKQEGTNSLTFNLAASTLGTLTRAISGAPLDIDTLSGGDDTVKNDDYIHVWIRVDRPERLDYVQIDFDLDAGGNFAENYYSARVPALTRLNQGSARWTRLQIRKNAFTRFGSSSDDWSGVRHVRLSFLSNNKGAVVIHTDDLKLRGGIGLEGDIEYTITYRNSSTGCRGNPFKNADGVVQYTTALTTDRQRITLTLTAVAENGANHPGDDQIDQMQIWRRGGSFTTAQFVENIIDTSTSHTDTTSDATLLLNVKALETNNDVPPTGTSRVLFGPDSGGHYFMIVDGHRLHISKPFEDGESRAENWPALQFALVGDGSHRALAGLATDTEVFVWTESETFQIVGIGADTLLPVAIPDSREIVGQFAATAGAGRVFFVAQDGIYEQRAGIQRKITGAIDPFFTGETVDGHAPMSTLPVDRANIHLQYYPDPRFDALVMVYPESADLYKYLVIKRNVQTGDFTEFYFNESALSELRSLYLDTEANEIIGGAANGHVYRIEGDTTENDEGTAISIRARTKSYDFGEPQALKKITQAMIEGDTNRANLEAFAYYDRGTTSEMLGTVNTSVSGDVRHFNTADPEARQDDIAIEIRGDFTQRVEINRFSIAVQVLTESRTCFDTGVITFGDNQLLKYFEFDLFNPDAVVTVRVYLLGALRDTSAIPIHTDQRIVRHFLPAGLKGFDVRVVLESTSAFELAAALLFAKTLGSAQGWRGRALPFTT